MQDKQLLIIPFAPHMATQDPAPLGPQPFEAPTPEANQALSQALGLAKPAPLKQAQQPAQTPPPAQEVQTNVVVNEKVVVPVGEQTPQPPATDTPATEQPAKTEPSAIDSLFESTTPQELPQDLTSLLKERYNIPDLAAHLKEHTTLREQLNIVQQEAATQKAIIEHVNSLSPDMLRAIEEDRKKPGTGVEFLRNLPKADYSRPGSEQDKFSLVESRYPGKFTDEEKADIRTGNADDALKRQFDRYHEMAVMDHDGARAKWQADRQKETEFRTQHDKKWFEHAAANYAHLEQNAKSLTLDLTPEIKKQHESGILYSSLFYTQDGFLKPQALELALTIKRLPDILDRVKKSAEVRGKNEGVAEAHLRLPSQPRPTGSEQTINKSLEQTPEQKLLSRILTGK